MKPAACLLAVGVALALGHDPLMAQMRHPASTDVSPHPFPLASASTIPEALYFSTPSDTLPDNTAGIRRSIGVRHGSTIGVQGVQFTLFYPATGIRVRRIEAGNDLPSPSAWTIDYQVHNARSGSEVTVIAFGADTTVGIPSGDHPDCFRVVFDTPDLKLCGSTPGDDMVAMTLGLGRVASSLANRYGQSARLVAADSVMRLAVFDAGARGDVDCAGGLDLLGVLHVADAVAGRRSLDASQRERADLAPWRGTEHGTEHGGAALDAADLKLMARAILLGEWPDGVPVTPPGIPTEGSATPTLSPEGTVTATITPTGIVVAMNNLLPVKGLQLAIDAGTIPEDARAVAASRIAEGFAVEQVMKDGELRLMIFPTNGVPIPPGDGTLLTIPLAIAGPPAEPKLIAMAAGDDGRRLTMTSGTATEIAGVDDRADAAGPPAMAVAPNPSAGSITLSYRLATRSAVTIALYDALGREVARPLDGARSEPGTHTIGIDAGDLPAGVYLCTITSAGRGSTARLVIAR